MGGASFRVGELTSEKDEDELCLVFSNMEDFEGDGRLMNEAQVEET